MTDNEKLIEAYEKYIQLLSDECSELSSMAYIHGWRSSRYEQGVKCREEISLLKLSARPIKSDDETASLRSEIASLRSKLDDCKRRAITGQRI